MDANANANANAEAPGSTIALRELCSGKLVSPNDADGMTNRVDSDQAVWSRSARFAPVYLSDNLGSLQ